MANYPITPEILLRWYNEYNTLYFEGKLPQAGFQNFCIRKYTHLGTCHYPKVVRGKNRPWMISETIYYELDERERRNTLLHEMCHLYCYMNGHPDAHHGRYWKAIARSISMKSGFDITRTRKGKFVVAPEFMEKQQNLAARRIDKMHAAYPIIVFRYKKEWVFIVKTTAGVLGKNLVWRNNAYRLKTSLQPMAFFLSSEFPQWTVRKGFKWGLLFTMEKYEDEIAPRLMQGKFETAHELYRAAVLD